MTLSNTELENGLNSVRSMVEQLTNRVTLHTSSATGQPSPNFPHGVPLFPVREIHGPQKDAVDSTHPMTFVVDFDQFVGKLYHAELRLKLTNLRSTINAATAASGGGTTVASAAGSAHTHTINSTTSAAGSSHTHTINSTTSAGGSAHTHTLSGVATAGDAAAAAPSPITQVGTANISTSHAHSSSAGNWSIDTSNLTNSNNVDSHTHSAAGTLSVPALGHIHTVTGGTNSSEATHTHTVSGITAVSESTHTHTVSGITAVSESTHTHNVTLSNHTHTITLTYGVFDGPAPVTPATTITINGTDRTSVLGGPWNASPASTLDVTAYLRESSGEPLRGANTIVLTSNEAIAIEVTLKSVVIPANLLAAGLS